MDVGIYALQTCRSLTGEEPESVLAMETKTDAKKYSDVEETLAWTMKMPGGVACHCGTSYSFDSLDGFRAYAENGWFGLEPAYRYDNLRGDSSDGPICCEPVDQFATEMDAFAQCILENRESAVAGEEGLRDLLAIEAIYESLREGKEVRL